MLALYLAALLAAVGVFALQFAFGHHDASGGHGGGHEGAWSLFLSTRFWTFALLAFGLLGTLLTLFGLAERWLVFGTAGAGGLASGLFAASVLRRLTNAVQSSHASSGDVVGQVGRVVVPLDGAGPGKVRVELKGSQVDYVARSKDKLDLQEAVVVEEVIGNEIVVSRAPKELKP